MDYLRVLTNCAAIIVFAFLGIKAINTFDANLNFISTKGVSDRIVVSDEAVLTITIINETDFPKDIVEKRKKELDSVLTFLKQNGIQESEIVGQFSEIDENYRFNDMEKKLKYKIKDKISIKSFRASDLKKLTEKFSEFIDQGIYLDFDIKYLYKNMDKLRIEMIEEATSDSRNRAERIAKISGSTIKNIKNLATGAFSIAAADSSATSNDEWSAERSLEKRVRVVVNGSFSIK